MESISYLTYLGVVVLLGLACSVISKKIAVPNILLVIFTGIFLNKFWDIINGGVFFFQKLGFIKSYTPYLSGPLIFFPPLFIAILALLALVMIVFESTSKFKYKDLDDFSLSALKLTIVFFAVNFAILSILTNLLFGLENIFLAGLFAALMSGTASDVVMSMIKETKNEVIKLLEIESIFNTPLIVIIPFLILELISNIGFLSSSIIISKLIEQLIPFLQQFITGIGAGVVIGLAAVKILREQHAHVLSPLALISAALLTYILAENLGGNGVLAVTAMGFIFGNMALKDKGHIQEFSKIFSIFLELVVFILIGLLIDVPMTFSFLSKSFVLFLIFLLIRLIAVEVALLKNNYTFKEKLFISLVVPKGIATAVVAVSLIGNQLSGMETILDLTLIFIVYSIVLASGVLKFSKFFINLKLVDDRDTVRKSVFKKSK